MSRRAGRAAAIIPSSIRTGRRGTRRPLLDATSSSRALIKGTYQRKVVAREGYPPDQLGLPKSFSIGLDAFVSFRQGFPNNHPRRGPGYSRTAGAGARSGVSSTETLPPVNPGPLNGDHDLRASRSNRLLRAPLLDFKLTLAGGSGRFRSSGRSLLAPKQRAVGRNCAEWLWLRTR